MTEATASRRTLLRAGGAAVAAAAATNGTSVASAQEDPYDGWFDETENYDGTVDARDEEEVEVVVGAGDDGLLFEPAAIYVSPGTTVVWTWTGQGGQHNVVDEEGAYGSELMEEEGQTFEQTFEEEGVSRYYCEPHEAVGMRGVVAVENVEGLEEDLVDEADGAPGADEPGEDEEGGGGEGDGEGGEGDGEGDEGDGEGGEGDGEGGEGDGEADVEGDAADEEEDGVALRDLSTADYVTIALALAFGLGLLIPLMYAAATAEID